MLHEKGLDINLLDKERNTILLLAAKLGIKSNLRYVKKLLDIGADPSITNVYGENFYTEAKKQALKDEDYLANYVSSKDDVEKHNQEMSEDKSNNTESQNCFHCVGKVIGEFKISIILAILVLIISRFVLN